VPTPSPTTSWYVWGLPSWRDLGPALETLSHHELTPPPLLLPTDCHGQEKRCAHRHATQHGQGMQRFGCLMTHVCGVYWSDAAGRIVCALQFTRATAQAALAAEPVVRELVRKLEAGTL
jgi:hypothetical protein